MICASQRPTLAYRCTYTTRQPFLILEIPSATSTDLNWIMTRDNKEKNKQKDRSKREILIKSQIRGATNEKGKPRHESFILVQPFQVRLMHMAYEGISLDNFSQIIRVLFLMATLVVGAIRPLAQEK